MSKTILLFLLITFSCVQISFLTKNIPPLDIEFPSPTKLTADICFGSIRQCFKMRIELNSMYSWIPNWVNSQSLPKFDDTNSKTVLPDKNRLTYQFDNDRTVYGQYVRDTMWIGDLSIKDILFISCSESKDFSNVQGVLGLGNNIMEPDIIYGFMTQIFMNGLINHRVFVIEQTSLKLKKGRILFGYIPDSILKYPENYAFCNWNTDYQHLPTEKAGWRCSGDGLLLGVDMDNDPSITSDSKVVIKFDLNTEKNILPISYWIKLENTLFKDQIQDGSCNFGYKKGYYTFTCDKNDYPSLTDVTIILGDWGWIRPKGTLFIWDEEESEYEFIFYGKPKNNDITWNMSFWENYWTVFDQENQTVGFYAGVKFVTKKKNVIAIAPKTYDNNNWYTENKAIPDDKDKEKVIPVDSKKDVENSFIMKMLSFIGLLGIVFGCLFFGWATFRYFRRKKYANPAFYYKATDDMFNEGIQWE